MRILFLLSVLAIVSGFGLSLQTAGPAEAAHHFAEISEVMSGFDGDPDVQYVEINMHSAGQNVVDNSRLTVFNSDRTFNTALFIVDSNVPNSGTNVKWIMGTTEFETASGIQADFEIPTGILPTAGMVCWGSPALVPPVDPNSWAFMNPNNYVDCVAYGGSSGANPPGNNGSVFGAGDCNHSLTRTVMASILPPDPPSGTWANTNSATQFTLAAPSPRNNSGNTGTLVGVNDADSDGALDCQETAAGSSSSDVDSDDDGCADGEELGVSKVLGGFRSPTNFWDFFDTPTGMSFIRDKAIAGTDFFTLLARFNQLGDDTIDPLSTPPAAPAYHTAFDRGGSIGPFAWNLGPADGSIAGTDFFALLGQFNDSCTAAPN